MDVAKELSAAVLLRHLDDFHVSKCRDQRKVSLGFLLFLFIAIPVIIAFVSDIMADIAVDIAIPTVISYIAMGFQTFYLLVGIEGIVLPLVALLAYFGFKNLKIYAVDRIKKKGNLATAEQTCPHWYRTKRIRKKRSFYAIASYLWAKFVDSISSAIYYNFTDEGLRSKKISEGITWANMNKAGQLQGRTHATTIATSGETNSQVLQLQGKGVIKSPQVLATIPQQVLQLREMANNLQTWTFKGHPLAIYANKLLFGMANKVQQERTIMLKNPATGGL